MGCKKCGKIETIHPGGSLVWSVEMKCLVWQFKVFGPCKDQNELEGGNAVATLTSEEMVCGDSP